MLTELWPLAGSCVTGIVFSVNTVTPRIGQTEKLLTTCFAFYYSIPVLWLRLEQKLQTTALTLM